METKIAVRFVESDLGTGTNTDISKTLNENSIKEHIYHCNTDSSQ